MRIKSNKTSRGECFYIIRSVYKNGKNTSETYEKLGYPEDIIKKYNCEDPYTWMDNYVKELNDKEKTGKVKVLVPFDPNTLIASDETRCFNIGYLFLQKIYYQLRLDLICKHISKRRNFQYDLNAILSAIVFGRILFPGSKRSTFSNSKELLYHPKFEYHQVVRALSVIADDFDNIQSELYKYSNQVIKRNTGVLYYDCTNFYFETEQEDIISNEEADENDVAARKYGPSKQHQPAPLVQMGLFMDYSGIPLAICVNRGNKNEQTTLVPLEKKIMQDFELSKFIVCTDAGLSSQESRMFNNFGQRSFITTISIKGMKKNDREWCLETNGWHLAGTAETFDISEIEACEELRTKYHDKIFYKEKYIDGYDEERDIEFNQTLIVTYSLKYKDYLKGKRDAQIERALKAMDNDKRSLEKKNQNDFRRFVKRKAEDKDGKNVKIKYELDQAAVEKEAQYDGFYAVITNLEDDVSDILKVIKGRWEIEESFRIMKDDFKSRPVYLSRNDRIKAHFMTCFISLLVYRILEKQLGNKYTCHTIVDTLKKMCMTKVNTEDYIPSYTRTEITDALHENAGFRTDYEITRNKAMKGVIRKTKQR